MLRRLPLVYLAVVVAVSVTRALWGSPAISAIALTPDRLVTGKVWLILTSAVVVNGTVIPQLAGLVPTVLSARARLGDTFTLTTMALAHIGATLLAYGALIVFTGDADGAHNRSFDYGISAVWLGLLGAVSVHAWCGALRGSTRDRAVVAAGVLAFAVGVAFFPLLAATEHGLAFALGASATAIRERRSAADLSARSVASTASEQAASA